MIPHRVETKDDLLAVWPTVVPWLEAALAHAPDDPATLLDAYHNLATDSQYHLWVCDSAALVTHHTPGRLHFWLAGGTMPGIQMLYPLAESLARSLGCSRMTLTGRLGWERSFLKRERWKSSLIEMTKRLP